MELSHGHLVGSVSWSPASTLGRGSLSSLRGKAVDALSMRSLLLCRVQDPDLLILLCIQPLQPHLKEMGELSGEEEKAKIQGN